MLRKLLYDWSEFWSLPMAVVLWVVSPYALRLIDPTAGTFDIGYIQKFILALVFMLALSGFSWMGVKYTFPDIFNYGDNGLDTDFRKLSKWQKISFYLFLPLFYMLLFVVLIVCL